MQWFRRGVGLSGIFGLFSGLFVGSAVLVSCGVLSVLAFALIERRCWLYVGWDTYVLHNGKVLIGQVFAGRYVLKSSLPKGFKVYQLDNKDAEIEVEFDLFVPNLVHGGSVIPLVVGIVCMANTNPDSLGLYCENFKEQGRTMEQYVWQLMRAFQQEQPSINGVFGVLHSTTMGTTEWAEFTLKPSLREFLDKRLARVGVIMSVMEVMRGKGDRCILRKVKGV
jgi:hypothetical protein